MPLSKEDFTFLFSFLNLHCKKGVPSCNRPQKVIQRTPVREPEIKTITKDELDERRKYYEAEGYSKPEIEQTLKDIQDNRVFVARDNKDNPHIFELDAETGLAKYVGCTRPTMSKGSHLD